MAEQKKIEFNKITEIYDELEKGMLKEFFEYLTDHRGNNYIHWNMRNINFGFQAIEHRYKVLGGRPYQIEDDRKIDLAKLLINIYSVRYASHGEHGRLHTVCKINSIKAKDMLTGKEEALAFQKKEYIKLHQSTLRKVDVMSNLLERVLDGSLKTQSSWLDKNGIHPIIFLQLAKEHWMIASILGCITFAGTIKTLLY